MTIVLIALFIAAIMFVIELYTPGRKWPQIRGWWLRAGLLNLVQVFIVFLAGISWDNWLHGKSLWNLSQALGPQAAAFAGYLTITFIYYWWHRARHHYEFFWRWLHQLHHSPQRLEIITSFYKHPAEIFLNSILSSLILYVLLGLSTEAATLAILLTGVAELFYHWNIKTPYWLGFIIQRPESHCIHHKKGWHNQNFSDLPLWDILFGTFHNPKSFDGKCGFKDNKEQLVFKMLFGKNVNRSK